MVQSITDDLKGDATSSPLLAEPSPATSRVELSTEAATQAPAFAKVRRSIFYLDSFAPRTRQDQHKRNLLQTYGGRVRPNHLTLANRSSRQCRLTPLEEAATRGRARCRLPVHFVMEMA